MTILNAQNLGKYFGGQDIFTDIDLAINHGDRIALVGPNGEGKTTLLRILAGLEPLSEGTVNTKKELTIGYLHQHTSLHSTEGTLWSLALDAFTALREQEVELRQLEEALAAANTDAERDQRLAIYGEAQAKFELAGGYTYEQTIKQVLTGLGFPEEEHHSPLAEFSGGQQSRAHLARLLLEGPDLLLLDEPTNHLDLQSVEWLEGYLQSWPKAFIVVAHDRYFLDRVAQRVWELAFGMLEVYRGNCTTYMQEREIRFDHRKKEYEAQQRFIEKEEEFIRRNLAGQRTKEAQGRRKRLERMAKLQRPQVHKTLHLPLQTTLRSGDIVLETFDLAVGYPDEPTLFTCPDLDIRRGNRIALLGPNGAGKTTFLKTILGDLTPQHGRIRLGAGVKVGYYAQTHADLSMDASILDEIISVKNLPIGEARNYLGQFLFSGDDVFKPIRALSGGERSRVAMAKLILTGANFLILDEPTNHLDLASQETLEDVLNKFEGTCLLVSHDRYFIDALASHTWVIDPTTESLSVVAGGYSSYLVHLEAMKASESDTNSTLTESQRTRQQTKAEQRAAQKKARELAEIESTIADTENKLTDLAKQLEAASHAQDIERLQTLGRDYQETEQKLETLLAQWVEMEAA